MINFTVQFMYIPQSAKLDPYSSEPFEYLGRFYTEIQKDKGKGKRCYQKAFDLDRNNDKAGEALCDLMTELGEEVNNYFKKYHGTLLAFRTNACVSICMDLYLCKYR